MQDSNQAVVVVEENIEEAVNSLPSEREIRIKTGTSALIIFSIFISFFDRKLILRRKKLKLDLWRHVKQRICFGQN